MAFTHKKTGSVIRAAGPFYFTPKMTDAAAPVPYVASASSYDSFLAFESFSGTTHEGWAGKGSWSGGYGNDWLKLDLGYMVAYPLSGYVVDKTNIFGKNRGGKAWTVWGSPDDTEESVWTLLDTVTGQTGWDTTDPVRQFDCDAGLSSKFRYLKWVFTENDGGDRIMPGQISLFYMPTDSLISYPMPVWVGESTEINIAFLQDWDSQPYATKNQTTVNSADGILDVTSTGTDPYISMYTLGSFDPNIYNGIRIRYKVVSGTAGNVQIYFTNARRTSANADQVVAVALISDGEWHICDIDMSAHRYWTNSNITGWRYDWCSANTVNMQIDYIALGTCRIGDVNCEGKCKSDFGDVRFYDGAGSKLDYMIDWKTLAGETPYQKVKMLVATNPEPDSMPVIIQYGDSGAMSESNPALVLYEYKNFESGVCDASISVSDADWVVDSGAVTIDATFLPHYPTEYSAATAKATTNFSSYYPYLAFNPSLSTVGGYSGVEWLTSTKTNQRLHVDCGEAFVCQFIEYVNGHASGGSTNIGCKDFTFWGSNSTDAFADTAYDHDDGWTQIDGSMQFAQHINSNVIDIHTIRLISNSASYRYYAFKIANNWGSTSYLSMRHIELKSMVTGGNQRAMLAGGATAAEAHIALTASNLQALQCRVEKNLLSAVYPILHGDGTKRVAIYCDTSNNINYLNSGGNVIDTGANCKHKAVVEIEVRNLQFEFGLYDIWVDGICVRYGAEMQTSADNEDEWAMLNAINNGYDAWVDDAAVRQYSNPEPTWGVWGEEEEEEIVLYSGDGPAGIKAWNGIPSASIKTWNGIPWNTIKAIQ